MTKILVALDESDSARHAARTAHELFGADAEYLAVSVASHPEATSAATWGSVYGYPFGAAPSVLDQLARSATDVVTAAEHDAADRADEAGLTADPLGAIGDPAHAIARAAQRYEVDVIVVGHQHHGWLRSLLDPSVADDLVDLTDVPVLVVPSRG